MLSQTEYYRSLALHPDEVEIEQPAVLERHARLRRHLYQTLLHVPFGLLRGADILDIGCGTGENALLLARYGAHVTLADQDPTVEPRLRRLFDGFGLSSQLREFVVGDIQTLRFARNFGLITVEGFLATVPGRDQVIRNICRALIDGGIAVVSYPDRFGSFFEFVKKAVMWRAFRLAGIEDVFAAPAEALAARLLKPALDALGSTRPFRVWWLDCMVAPFLTWDLCWSPDAILAAAAPEGGVFHAATPRVWEPDPLDWFKRVLDPVTVNQAVADGYAVRKYDLMFARPIGLVADRANLAALDAEIEAILRAWSVWFADVTAPPPALDFRHAAGLFRQCGVDLPELDMLSALFDLIRGHDLQALIDGYLGAVAVSQNWGKSYQYLAFSVDRAGRAGVSQAG